MSRIVLGLLHNYNTFVYSRFFNFNILHSFNNKPRVSLYATPLTSALISLYNCRHKHVSGAISCNALMTAPRARHLESHACR